MIQQLESGQDVTHLFNGLKSGDDVTHLFENDNVKPETKIKKEETKSVEPIKESEKPKEEPKQGFLSKAWHTLSDPLTDAPSRFANKVANYIDEPSLDSNPISPYIKGFLAGSTQGLGNLASGMTSPLNLGLTLASGGEYGAVKAGLPKVAQLMNYGVKALSAPVALHGASNVLSPDSTLEQRLMGIPEIAGGIAGLRSKVPEISESISRNEVPQNLSIKPKSKFEPLPINEGESIGDYIRRNGIDSIYTTPEEALANRARQEPLRDETGKEIAPPQNFPQERPNGPWDKNISQDAPKNGADQIYDLARNKFNMGKDLPVENEQTGMIKRDKTFIPEILSPDQYTKSGDVNSPTFGNIKRITPLNADPEWNAEIRNLWGDMSEKEINRYIELQSTMNGPLKEITPELHNEFVTLQKKRPGTPQPDQYLLKQQAEQTRLDNLTSQQKQLGEQPIQPPTNIKPQFNPKGKTGLTGSLQSGNDVTHLFNEKEPTNYPMHDAQLPRDLQGAKPRFNMGQNSYEPNFKSDLDKALYIIAQKNPSHRNADYLKFVMDSTGMNENEAIQAGINIRSKIKELAKNSKTGELEIPQLHGNEWKPTNIVTSRGEEINTETGEIKPPKQPPPPNEPPNGEPPNNNPKEPNKPSLGREMYEMSRQLMSVDLPYTTSAAFRQAAPMIGTKEWFKAWIPSAQSYGSKAAYESIMQRIENEPLVKPDAHGISFIHDTMGIKLTDLKSLSSREEFTRSQLAEKIPIYGKHIAGSNRAYTAFLNDLRVNTAKNLISDAEALGLDPKNNIPLAKQIGEFINTATGRGSLQTSIGLGKASYTVNMEKNAKLLTDVFFSPRLMASRIQMLNPQTYIMAQPFVRKQYLYGMMRAIGAWWSVASLAKLAGGNVSTDANNADFGKIKIGNTRIDPGAGFQQYLVLGHRMLPGGGITSSNTGKFTEFSKGYKPNTRLNTIEQFGASKLHPELKLAYDLLNANPSKPVFLGDRAIQMAVPMVASDLMELAKQDPSIAMLIGIPLAGTSGIGVQTYDKNSFKEPTFTGKNWDMRIPMK